MFLFRLCFTLCAPTCDLRYYRLQNTQIYLAIPLLARKETDIRDVYTQWYVYLAICYGKICFKLYPTCLYQHVSQFVYPF